MPVMRGKGSSRSRIDVGLHFAVTQVFLALGSNLDDPLKNLAMAASRIDQLLSEATFGGLYRTAPMYFEDQPSFVNGSAMGWTDLGPLRLLAELKRIEIEIGRQDSLRNGPRAIDIDLIGYGALKYSFRVHNQTTLEIPHPRLAERRFVLAPLADIAPAYAPPGFATVSELLAQTNDQEEDVVRLTDAVLPIRR